MYNVLEVAREKLERRFPQASKISVDVAARYVKKKKKIKKQNRDKKLESRSQQAGKISVDGAARCVNNVAFCKLCCQCVANVLLMCC